MAQRVGTIVADLRTGNLLHADHEAMSLLRIGDLVQFPLRVPEFIDPTGRPVRHSPQVVLGSPHLSARTLRGVRWDDRHPWIWVWRTVRIVGSGLISVEIEPAQPPTAIIVPHKPAIAAGLVCPATGAIVPRRECRGVTQEQVDKNCLAEITGEPCFASCSRSSDKRWLHHGPDVDC